MTERSIKVKLIELLHPSKISGCHDGIDNRLDMAHPLTFLYVAVKYELMQYVHFQIG